MSTAAGLGALAREDVGRLARVRRSSQPARGTTPLMFLFFSNGLGCLPSLLLSIGVTVVLLLLLGVL